MATSIKIPIKLYYPGEYSFAEAGGDDPKEKESKKEREKKKSFITLIIFMVTITKLTANTSLSSSLPSFTLLLSSSQSSLGRLIHSLICEI